MTELPKYAGLGGWEGARSFINDFELAMLERRLELEDERQAEYFVRSMVPGSAGETWLESLAGENDMLRSYRALKQGFEEAFTPGRKTVRVDDC